MLKEYVTVGVSVENMLCPSRLIEVVVVVVGMIAIKLR